MLGHPVPRTARLGVLMAVAMVAALLTVPAMLATAEAAGECGPSGNAITCENAKPGTDSDVWDIHGAGDPEIQGFATDISVNAGQRVDFKIDTSASSYTVDIYRMGYYQGNGARWITEVTPSATLPQVQPECVTDVETELYDCGNWGISASWDVPASAVSGVYIAHITRSTGDGSHITFVVRNDASQSDVVFQTADPTWHAYNTYGGAYFYGGGAHGRAYKISYNRPFLTRGRENGRDFFMSAEYAMVRFMERNGYDVSYIAGVDSDRRGHLLTNHDVFLSVGHDEYWSKAQRANVEAARDAGVHLQFLAGNEVYWKTRYEPSIDGSNTAHRTLTSYKETWSQAKIDPSEEWTGTFRDPRFAPASRGGGTPENALIGTQYMVNFSDLALQVNAAEGKLRLWRHTDLVSMAAGTTRTLAPHTIGYESNEDVDNGHRPGGLIRLSTTTGAVPEYLQDFGNTVAPGTTTHHLTLYKASSGALVFSAGTVQWSWGLDEVHDSAFAREPADPRMQQAQVNLFADMGVQPVTLASHLVRATRTSDTVAPTVTVTNPAAGSTTQNGKTVTVTGTASDTAGRVAGVEVSTDGGLSWSAAVGTSQWSYSFLQQAQGASVIRVRAMDDSANIGAAVTRSFNATCPCTLFGDQQPKVAAVSDASANELGIRFVALADGFVTGVRFYKGVGNAGTHTGSLWARSGERLAQATFTGETATGWQEVTFAAPVPVSAGQSYVASYTAPTGHYALKSWAFSESPHDAGPLLVEGGFGAEAAGVYGAAGSYPSASHQNSNYYVDVAFTTTHASPLIALNHWPLPQSSSVPATTTLSARFSKPVGASSVSLTLRDSNGASVAGATSYDPITRTATFTPSAPLAGFVEHTATIAGHDTSGNPVTVGQSWSFTTVRPPSAPGVCPCSLFDDGKVPATLETPEQDPVTLGVRFTSDDKGAVTGIRFYKGPHNTGTHTGTLWSSSGTALATGTFSQESSSGWQTLMFDQPVMIEKNTPYIASYRTTQGRYSITPSEFASANLSRPPLKVGATAGAYTYGTGFPAQTSSSNYLVDVVFERILPGITVAAQQPAPGAMGVARRAPVTVDFSVPIKPGWSLTASHLGSALAGAATLSDAGTRLTWRPAAPLPPDAEISFALAGVVSTDDVVLGTQAWSFHTRSAESLDDQTLFGDVLPEVTSAPEGASVELGVSFTPSQPGQVTAIRFFKGTGNDGIHTGSLWTATGVRLSTVTFEDETATGWQTAVLPEPVTVAKGQTYVVSYLAPQGHYSFTGGFFDDGPWSAGDLTAPATANGRYLYGPGGGFPTFHWNGANYFVDVVFAREVASIAVASRTPASGATSVSPLVSPSVEFSAQVADGWSMTVQADGAAVPGAVRRSSDGRTLTFDPDDSLPTGAQVTVSLTGVVSVDGATLGSESWSFTTAGAHSLFDGLVPQVAAASDPGPVELGTAFTPSVDGEVTGIRFHKGPGNIGTHTGSVWGPDGSRLATVTFTQETVSGWQEATLPTPVPVVAGTTYVVSYFAPEGAYSVTPNFFSTPHVAGPLTAPAGHNGRYRYGPAGGLPDQSWNSSNYLVDVLFRSTP